MSLRVHLVALVVAALAASLALGGVLILANASRSVENEMRAALLVGHQTVDAALGALRNSPDPRRSLDALIGSFRGNRHLRVSLAGGTASEQIVPSREHSPFGRVPAWFGRLIGVAPQSDGVPIASRGGQILGVLVLTTDPRNEILEVWNELNGSLVVLALFCALTIVLIALFTGRALRPLDRLAAALEQVGRGDYGTIRPASRLTPELARLRDAFNRMAARLAAADADNRRLNEQLLTLQEEERSDIARDLHDEVGPLLFAINVDVGTLTRLVNREDRTGEELATPVHSIAEAARQLQRHVRGMLGRLRPVGLPELGLDGALLRLVDFWRRRHPQIDYRIALAPDCRTLGERLDTTIYRLVQECLSNSVRHGDPTTISISIGRDERQDLIRLEVTDDGAGLRSGSAIGYGLVGMEERVRALGGNLTLANRASGGLAVTAVMPGTEADVGVASPSLLAEPVR